jgi:hypothetical protein
MLTFFQLNCDAADCVAFGLDAGLNAGLSVDHVVCVDDSVFDDDNSVDDDWFDDNSVDDNWFDDNSVDDDWFDDDSIDRVKQF